LEALSTAERRALAEHWTRLGQMEHASIAAFARFSLQLLSLGAPAPLVEACTEAIADETAHAKLCFGLASAYAGRALGPGALEVGDCLAATHLSEIARLVIAEGCFGETLAALEALEASEAATDPTIRAVFSRIAADEQRHATLAFQFVRWAMQKGGEALRLSLAKAMLEQVAAHEQREHRASALPLEAHGVLSSAALRALHRQAVREVVVPCLAALLATPARLETSEQIDSGSEHALEVAVLA